MIYHYDFAEDLQQSDVFRNVSFSCENGASKYAVLLNPLCDLVTQEFRSSPKAKYFKFAAIVDVSPLVMGILSQLKISKDQIRGTEYIDGETFDDVHLLIRNFVNGAIYPRYFFLPPLNDHYSFSAIDFQLIEIKKYSKELVSNLRENRVAQIKSSWKEAIPVRYSSYSSRIGLDDYPPEIFENLLSSLSINLRRSS